MGGEKLKLIHLSDLHIGKRVNGFSMLDDQKRILEQIIGIVDAEQPDAVIIAGDVYDKSVPSTDAVQVFDDFLYCLSLRKIHVFVISGNHDSPERIAFGSRIMDAGGIHMSQVYGGKLNPTVLYDEWGAVDVYMLPFIKPAHVRSFRQDAEITSYTDAVRTALEGLPLCSENRNVLITHQFITNAERSESEEVSVGGADNVDADVFDGFDYVALGHIHKPQFIGRETIRYCGTPLKYSLSEADQNKTVTIVEMTEKGNINIRELPLLAPREIKKLKGTFEELTRIRELMGDDYYYITLTDEDDIPNALTRLRDFYPNLMKLDYDNKRTRTDRQVGIADDVDSKTPIKLFEELYELQNNQPMSEEQRSYVNTLIEKIWEGSL